MRNPALDGLPGGVERSERVVNQSLMPNASQKPRLCRDAGVSHEVVKMAARRAGIPSPVRAEVEMRSTYVRSSAPP